MTRSHVVRYVVLACLGFAQPLYAQDSAAIKLQVEKLAALQMMDGVWRGEAWIITPQGRQELTQTERVGSMLNGAIKVIEGRGYDAADNVAFNAFAVISYDAEKNQYAMRSYAQGRQGDFVLTLTDDGYSWSIPAGPATIRYTAKVTDGEWYEYGERIVGDQKPSKFFEMKLRRIGDSTWPAGGAVPSK